ncbi:MAG: VOC family protein [Candidatus Lutacidiplasmatales archaeon]
MTDWISSTAIFVRSRKRAAKWYSQVFGWKNLADDDHWTVVGPAKRGGRLHLCERRKLGASHVGETGILIVCEQFDRTVARLEKAGARWATAPVERPWGKMGRFKDPDGNILWISTDA